MGVIMKKLFVVICALMLSGCFYQDIQGYWIDRANAYCKARGGIHEMTSWNTGHVQGYCTDGVKFSSRKELKK